MVICQKHAKNNRCTQQNTTKDLKNEVYHYIIVVDITTLGVNIMDNEKDEKYERIVTSLNQTICKNLQALLKARNLSQKKFCQLLTKEKTSVTRAHFNKILHNPQYISAAFLLSCCDFFGISLKNLASPNFNANEYIYNDTPEHEDYLKIARLLKNYSAKELPAKQNDNNINPPQDFAFPLGTTNLITDPSNTHFNGNIQDYYCYYYPTHSSENKEENIIKGILHLTSENTYCKAVLKIDTNTADDEGNINYKEYVGYATISPTVNSLSCVMYSDSLCEFCFLMFRFFKLNFGKQDCRIAEVLSSSSATEERRPTVLRMLLSKEKIKDDDLKLIAPAFSLNYSTIAVSQKNLNKISTLSSSYKNIIDDFVNNHEAQLMYFDKEDLIYNLALKHLNNKEAALEFLMQLRSVSYSYKYNKVGKKADDAVRNILLSKGYFKKRPVPKRDE